MTELSIARRQPRRAKEAGRAPDSPEQIAAAGTPVPGLLMRSAGALPAGRPADVPSVRRAFGNDTVRRLPSILGGAKKAPPRDIAGSTSGLAPEHVHILDEVRQKASHRQVKNHTAVSKRFETLGLYDKYGDDILEETLAWVKEAPLTVNLKASLIGTLAKGGSNSLRNAYELEDMGVVASGTNKLRDTTEDKMFGFKRGVTKSSDRPLYAAPNVGDHQKGSIPSGTYGNSHFVLKEDVKARSTFTGTDSFGIGASSKYTDKNTRKAMTTHEHPEVILANAPDHLLEAAAHRASIDGGRSSNNNLDHMEAQIFGGITMSDVSKLVVDESELKRDHQVVQMFKGVFKLESSAKTKIRKYAKDHGFAVEFIPAPQMAK